MPSHHLRLRSRPVRLGAVGLACGMALGLGVSTSVRAQSLLELYTAASGYDATYQSARLQADASVFRSEQTRALKRPSVNLVGKVGTEISEAFLSDPGVSSFNLEKSAAVSAKHSLFNRANDFTITQSERAIDVARAQLAAAEQDLIIRVTQAYFDVLTAQDALDSVRASKAAIAEQLASAKRNFEVGTATITDTREAEARFDLARAQELAAENDLNDRRLALDQIVGRTGVQPLRLLTPVQLPLLAPADVEQWVRQAEDNSPGLRQLRLALDVARLETEKARAGGLPTLAVAGSVGGKRTHSRTDTSGVDLRTGIFGPQASNNNNKALTTSVGLEFSMPLYSGDSIQNRIKETLALEDKAASDLEAARRNVTQGTRTAYFGVGSLRARIAALEAAESSSKLALEATQLGYKVGVRVNLDVLNAQTQLYQAQRDLAKARYDLVVNSLKLRQAAGVLQPQDVNAVNGLLAPR